MTSIRTFDELPNLTRNPSRGALRVIDLGTDQAGNRRGSRAYWTGQMWQLGTAAYWEALVAATPEPPTYQLGASLAEELGACILGGYGVPFAVGNAAFEALRHAGVFKLTRTWTAQRIERELLKEIPVGGRRARYRFPHQRSQRLASALDFVRDRPIPRDDRQLRNDLLTIDGVGLKTASWVVRNFRASDDVAIIDIHLVRAGVVAGVFNPAWRLPRDYELFELAFLSWAAHAGLRPRLMDSVIWSALARDARGARDILGIDSTGPKLRAVWPTTGVPSPKSIDKDNVGLLRRSSSPGVEYER